MEGAKLVINFFGYRLRMKLLEAHHLYWGIALMAISVYSFHWSFLVLVDGCLNAVMWKCAVGIILLAVSAFLFLVGAYVARDDIIQHHRQVDDENYHSPVHVWYRETLWRYEPVRKVNRIIDAVMSNPLIVLIVMLFIVSVYLCVK